MADDWSRQLFLALLRRYELKPYRYRGQRYTTVMVKVPKKFVICVNFNPTRTKGVYVSHDAQGTGLVGLPGKPAGSFTGGDWLIHVTVDRRRQ